MKKFYLFVLVFFILSCSKENEIEPPFCNGTITELGIINVNPNSLSFIPYSGEENIYFRNENGDEVKFEPAFGPKKNVFQDNTFEITCDNGGVDYYKFIREQYAVSFKCIELNLEYYLNLYTHNSSIYPIFVDEFWLRLLIPPTENNISFPIFLNIITSFNGNEDLLKDEFESFDNYEFVDELELLNMTFNNVYKITDLENRSLLTELYFNKDYGVIGFKSESNIWVFNRFE